MPLRGHGRYLRARLDASAISGPDDPRHLDDGHAVGTDGHSPRATQPRWHAHTWTEFHDGVYNGSRGGTS